MHFRGAFIGRSKKTAWDVWNAFHDVTPAFVTLSTVPVTIDDDTFQRLQRFVVLLYDRTSSETDVNIARKVLFSKKSRQMNTIPPTKGALREHCKRAAYQAGYVWGQSLLSTPELPSPDEWGWTKREGLWAPFWTSMPEAAQGVQAIMKCGCKKGCTARCKCVKAALACTSLCFCEGDCTRN